LRSEGEWVVAEMGGPAPDEEGAEDQDEHCVV
jgi:hypothetical protein